MSVFLVQGYPGRSGGTGNQGHFGLQVSNDSLKAGFPLSKFGHAANSRRAAHRLFVTFLTIVQYI